MSGSTVDCRLLADSPATVWRWPAVLRTGCRYGLAAVFLLAGVTKVTDLPGFADRVLVHSDLPYSLGLATAAFLPWFELTCGLCLVLGYAVREAALLLALLLVGLLGYGLTHLHGSDCSCFVFPVPPPNVIVPLADARGSAVVPLADARGSAVVPLADARGSGWWPPVRNLLLLACCLSIIWPRQEPRAGASSGREPATQARATPK